ncbi:MAG: rhodanese-like domain-containing protein [Acidimicrobiia bacterium]|nr:MAG: rhodanese-like domain-containing protein [Acidimicrobiia bacterium]
MIKTLDIGALVSVYQSPGVKVVDARPTAAYNGWCLGDESRGGHIPGAVAFPQSWAAGMYDADLAARLAAKGVTPDQSIAVYGYGDGDATALAGRLLALGYDDVAVLAGGLPDWAAQPDLDVTRLPRYHQLVHPQWVRGLLDGGQIDEAPVGDSAVFHVNYGVPEEYERGHIPGAIHLDTNTLESATDWNRRSPEDLEAAIIQLGISRDTTVIVYGRDTAADPTEQKPGRRAGQIAATRAAAILLYAGVDDVRLLDGGLNVWLAAGYPVETEIRIPAPAPEFGTTIPARSCFFIDFEEAVDLIADPDGVLVSIRSSPENRGETSGYNYIEELGDIPGAVWTDCGSDAYHMQHYRNIDNTMRDFNEIASAWGEAGITPDKKVAFYCGTGWRASETFFYAYLMDWPDVSVYDGGWFEWSRRVGEVA